MIKTLIVEDEILARLGLRQLVDWESMGFTLLEDAKDGHAALTIIESERPQLLLLDINIPEMNGLQLLERMRDKGIKCATIVISCDNDMNTVKQAMKLGAVDYFHKMSLSPKELTQLLTKCKVELDQQTDRDSGPRPLEELEYEEILGGEYKRILGECYNTGYPMCVAAPLAKREDLIKIDQLCRSILMDRHKNAAVVNGEGLLYLIQGSTADREWSTALWDSLQAQYPGRIYLGVGKPWSRLADMKESVFLAEQIKTLAFYEEDPRLYICSDKLSWCDRTAFSLHSVCADIVQGLDGWDQPLLHRLVAQCMDDLKQQRYLRLPMLRRIFMDLLSTFSARAQMLGGAIEEIQVDGQSNHFNSILKLKSFQQAKVWFAQLIDSFFSVFAVREKCSHSELLQKTLTFVETNLYSVIRLVQMSKEIGVSEAYLSSLFRKEMGETLINYVNRRKVDEAKRLLADGKLVYEVSELLGFEYTTYFSKIFKRYTSETPDNYRKRHLGDQAAPETDIITENDAQRKT